jgi:hypothetical protein
MHLTSDIKAQQFIQLSGDQGVGQMLERSYGNAYTYRSPYRVIASSDSPSAEHRYALQRKKGRECGRSSLASSVIQCMVLYSAMAIAA